jgi:Concanavalin A-like lectin/glucanases superfamily
MAATQWMICASATEDLTGWTQVTGSCAFDGTVVRSGQGSYKLTTGAGNAAARLTETGVLADAGRRISFWFRFNQAPAANCNVIIAATTGSLSVVLLGLTTTNTLFLNTPGAGSYNSSTVLSVNTWYRLTLSYVITSTTVFSTSLYINGALDGTHNNAGTMTRTGSNYLLLDLSTAAGANTTFWYDEIYVDNGTTLDDPGVSNGSSVHNALGVTAKLPASVNVGGWDTAIGSGAVNGRPIGTANGQEQAGSGSAQQNYTLQAPSVGDVDVSNAAVFARMAWIYAKSGTAGSGNPKLMDNGLESDVTLTTSPALYTHIVDGTAYPFDKAGVGMKSNGSPAATYLYGCGTMLAYVPGIQNNVTFLVT